MKNRSVDEKQDLRNYGYSTQIAKPSNGANVYVREKLSAVFIFQATKFATISICL